LNEVMSSARNQEPQGQLYSMRWHKVLDRGANRTCALEVFKVRGGSSWASAIAHVMKQLG
jgi:hypothetical protein